MIPILPTHYRRSNVQSDDPCLDKSSTKGNASGGSKSKDGAKAARDGRVGSDEARLGTKLKKSSDVLTDEQELDGFVVADGEVLSE